ncbi:PIN domain-containing protein [Candidatus Woesearchaeota archaeon]|nr:PIN domain-containing protein [Candidatus Woesearchaeota archaeon]
MEFVIDANILMSALVATEGATYDLMFSERMALFAPEFLMEEFEKYKNEILKKSGLSQSDFELFLSLISSRIELIPKKEFKKLIPEAKKITPDPKDTEYIALALKMRCSLWSNDKRLKEQDKVNVYSTGELLKIIQESIIR